ncbi:Hypothetical Protein FCC1311_113162 [Hondaea fermentalgiana]|uniref:Uncharacterized protein n=1 Tax=Hondaea fermentalgiana TaxID=2315210 RepID=A0A2R5H1X9_9STRA|nr:Hypothetical Protein FCC1311_113162 [Hondaea fermentalgiana]|eukprot:GBG35093.1 Hypothetical Protein FCC1311_113162 [Hondaea fermentalgiana]
MAGKVCIDHGDTHSGGGAVLNDRVAFLFLERDDGSSQVGAVAEGHSDASMALAESLLVVIRDQAAVAGDGETGAAADIILAENSTCREDSMAVTVDVDVTAVLALDGAADNESAAFMLSRVDELDWELGGYYCYEEGKASVLHAAPKALQVEAAVDLEEAPTFLATADDGPLVLCGSDTCSRYELAAGTLACSAAYKRQGSVFVALRPPATRSSWRTPPAPTTATEPATKPRRDAGPSALVWTLSCAAAAALVALLLVFARHRRGRYQQHQKVSTVELAAQPERNLPVQRAIPPTLFGNSKSNAPPATAEFKILTKNEAIAAQVIHCLDWIIVTTTILATNAKSVAAGQVGVGCETALGGHLGILRKLTRKASGIDEELQLTVGTDGKLLDSFRMSRKSVTTSTRRASQSQSQLNFLGKFADKFSWWKGCCSSAKLGGSANLAMTLLKRSVQQAQSGKS